jgi:hypothetical protein
MLYNRLWFFDNHIGFTMGGGVMHNPGRYLVLAPTGNASPFPQPLNTPAATQPYDLNPGRVHIHARHNQAADLTCAA